MSILYQLATGKIVTLSVDDLLNMTDEDEQYLISLNAGEAPGNPFYGSSITSPRRNFIPSNPYERDGLDYEEDPDEVEGTEKFDINNIPDDSITD